MPVFTSKPSWLLFYILTLGTCVSLQQKAVAADWDGFSVTALVGTAQQSGNASAAGRPTANTYFSSASDLPQVASAGSGSFSGSDSTGSFKIGYSWQSGNVVQGIDFSADTGFDRSFTGGATWISVPTAQFSITQRIKAASMLAIRPRIGWAWDNAQVYVTAGVAAARVTLETSFMDNFVSGGASGASGQSSQSETKIGTMVGFGAEYALDKVWSLSAQYLYTDFGHINNVTNTTHLGFGASGFGVIDSSAALRNQSIMVGLTYRFKN